MGPNGSGKSTLSHVVMGRPGYEVLGGLGHPRRRRPAGAADLAAGRRPGCSSPCSTRPRCRACASTTCSPRRCAAQGRDVERAATAWSAAEAERIGFDDRFLDRPLNVDLSGGEKKRNETLQLAVLQPEDRHPRRARLRPRHRRAARPAPAASRPRPTTTDLGVLAITHYNRLLARAAARPRAHPREGPHRAVGRCRARGRARSRGLRALPRLRCPTPSSPSSWGRAPTGRRSKARRRCWPSSTSPTRSRSCPLTARQCSCRSSRRAPRPAASR